MWVLGLNSPPFGWHDASAALVNEAGDVEILVEEERPSRIKHALRHYPRRATKRCLEFAGLTPRDIDIVAVGWDLPRQYAKFGRGWPYEEPRDFLQRCLGWEFAGTNPPELVFVGHHLAHALSAFYPSGFDKAAVLVVDGNGDEEGTSIYEASLGVRPVLRERWPLSQSLGWMYDATSRAIGFTFLEAGKTMGLAAYGQSEGIEPLPLLDIDSEIRVPFSTNSDASYEEVIRAWFRHFSTFELQPIQSSTENLNLCESAVRLAWSAQAALQEAILFLAQRARKVSETEALCLAGGVALNCSANSLLSHPIFIPPFPHDSGVALGAAWHVCPPREKIENFSPYIGSGLSQPEVESSVIELGCPLQEARPDEIVRRVLKGEVGAVVEGRAEVGPRALGHRSIIAAPYDPKMRDRVNRIKGREPWRPLAPIGLPEVNGALWESRVPLDRYMLAACPVFPAAKEAIPAAVHVDNTARAQIAGDTLFLSEILREISDSGAPPVLINTSLNSRGEPIVDSLEDAVAAFQGLHLDFLVLDRYLLSRE